MDVEKARRSRGRSKSSSGAPGSDQEEELARNNVNGKKDGGCDDAAAATAVGDAAETAAPVADEEDAPEEPRTRKRKAPAELRSEDDSGGEEAAKKPAGEDAFKEIKQEEQDETTTDNPPTTTEEPTPMEIKTEVTDESSATDSPSEIKDISMTSEKHALGKGKRARIPNKRYSDITPMKAVSFDAGKTRHNPENGQPPPDNDLTEILREESESESHSLRRSGASPAGGPPSKKQKASVDLTNPCYLKPFEFGWKRELVYRANTDSTLKRNGDIYYYTPTGKKVRSMREVAENLSNRELSMDDFTFFKEPLGIDDPDKEIIRDAKFKTAGIVSEKVTPRKVAKTPKVGSPRVVSTPAAESPAEATTPKATGKPSRSTTSLKVKIPKTSSTKKEKKPAVKEEPSSELEIGTYPPSWTPSPKKGKTNKKVDITKSAAKNKPNTRGSKSNAASEESKQNAAKPMDTYLQNLAYGYNTLLYVFQYLKVQDLLRAGCVCTMWRDVARHSLLWRTVRMKNSQIHSFEGLANALQNHGTVHLDLRKMLLPTHGGDDIWPSFTNAIKKVESLRKIELCRCLASVVEELANNNHNLEAINAVTIKCESMSFEPFRNLSNLTDLRIKSTAGLTLTSDLSALRELTKMKHLSITSIKDLNKLNIEVIGELVNLEVLDIGECADFPANFGPDILSKLSKLEKLRLEKGQGECHTFEILDAVKDLNKLHQLELVNFDIKFGFDKALGACKNIKKLLIIPTYISQSATTNHMVLGGVLKLQKTLSHFVWGVTLELLRVTELFVDQCEQPDKRDVKEKNVNSGDSIPILKPVPLYGMQEPETPPDDAPQVDILPLPNLQKLLLQNLPTTRVKILKIPFHATWRQSITESVN